MSDAPKKLLLAGATGLVGSNIIQYVQKNHPSMNIRGTYCTHHPFIRGERLEYVQADLTRREDCRRAIEGCDWAVMAAARTGGAGATAAEPYRQTTDNLVMDAFLLEALALARVQRVIFLSTATAYQEFEGSIKEDEMDFNQDPYSAHFGVGWAKRSAEKLCQFWHEKYGLKVVVLRCANIYGPFASFSPQKSNFISALIKKAVDKMDPFEVWGSSEVTRDVIYAEDFARAVITLLVQDDFKFDVFNLGSGVPTTVGDVVGWALNAADHYPKNIVYSERRPTTIPFRALDCTEIKRAIGWETVFPSEDGVRLTTRWWMENRDWWKR